MSSPSMSSLKSCPCRPPLLEKSTSKSNFTLLSVVCSSTIDRLSPQRHPTILTQPRRRDIPRTSPKRSSRKFAPLHLVTFVVTLRRRQCCRVGLWQKGQGNWGQG